MRNRIAAVLAAALCTLAAAPFAHAAVELSYTYAWGFGTKTGHGDLKATEWNDADQTNNVLLNNGEFSPNGVDGWGVGQKGVIIQNINPLVTLDLGSPQELLSLVLRYNVHYGAAAKDPTALSITIDGGTPILFNSFPVDSQIKFSRVVPIDLTGITGQIIKLQFTNGSEWFPFSEIDVFGPTPVPAPAAMPAGLAMLGLIAARHRRRRA